MATDNTNMTRLALPRGDVHHSRYKIGFIQSIVFSLVTHKVLFSIIFLNSADEITGNTV